MRKNAVFFAAALTLASAGACQPKPEAKPAAGEIVASVGDFEITRQMVDLRMKSLAGGHPPADPDVFALAQLVQGHLAVWVVNRYSEYVSNASAKQFLEEGRPYFSPAFNAAVTGQPEALVMATFAKPGLAMSLISETFDQQELSPENSNYVFRILRDIRNAPKDLRNIAAREQGRVDEVWIGPASARERADHEIYGILRSLKPGAVYSRPVLRVDAFQIYRVEERRGDQIRALVVSLPKPSIDDWFWGQVQDIPVEIFDAALREKFVTSVPFAHRLRSREGRYPARYAAPRSPGPWRPE